MGMFDAQKARRPFCVFGVPTLTGRVGYEFTLSALATQEACAAAGIDRIWAMFPGDNHLGQARSRIASAFLRDYPHATDLFFLDDDLAWPPEKVVEFVRRPEPVICGIYPKKNDRLEFPVRLALEHGKPVERDGLVKIERGPTGFMRIKRHVIEAMTKDAGIFVALGADGAGEVEVWDLFQAGYVEDRSGRGHFVEEDYRFCDRWRAMGGEAWCDPDITFAHRGSKAWTANFGEDLREKHLGDV